jgi:hypothetical protein
MDNGADAMEDVKLMLYLADTLRSDPFLYCYLIRLFCVRMAISPIWEGLSDHHWNADELRQLQAALEPHNFVADSQRPLQAIRAEGVAGVDWLRKKGLGWFGELSWIAVAPSPGTYNSGLESSGRMMPSGWYDREKLNFCLLYDRRLQGGFDETRIFPRQLAANASKWKTHPYGIWNNIACHENIATMMSPRLETLPQSMAAIQTANDQAIVACALERYRLSHNQFPENLQALIPGNLTRMPNDVFTGEAFHFRRTDDGRFILYSIGWNERDDGGVLGESMFDNAKGDWVW